VKPFHSAPLKNILRVLLPLTFLVSGGFAAALQLGYLELDLTIETSTARGALAQAPMETVSREAALTPSTPTRTPRGALVRFPTQITPIETNFTPSTPTRTPFRPVRYTRTPTKTPLPTHTTTPTQTPTNTSPPPPPPPPPAPELPDQASVSGVVGHPQSLGLSCEARSAVDWAGFFGWNIGEMEFLGGLPRTDNPETGFVGSPSGAWGQVPPGAYGVHAAPVAALLRAYGIPAEDHRGLSWEDLREEISAGKPVVVWVIGGIWQGYAVDYTPSDGATVRVAPFEHTVIVTGYSASSVSIVDNHLYYDVPVDRFLSSWSVLGNQAVTYE
jgi:uncharacterized protein YvpB